MSKALKLLNKHNYKCPSDTEKLLLYKDGFFEPAKPLIWNLLESEYRDRLKRNFVEEAYAHLQRANVINRKKINQYTNKIPIENGIFNLLQREIEPFNPEQVYTYKLNIKYDPVAQCPKWIEFVKQVVSEDDIPLLQEIMGYCLVPAMPFHKMFWLYGTGRNGKGVVVRTLEHILGEESCANLNLSEFRESRRFSLSQLYGKLLNVSSEPPLSKYGLPTTVLKMVTGQDTIRAELKCKNERLVFTNFAKMLVLGNHFPKVEDNSLGWWDRVETLNFPNSFEGIQCIPDIERNWIPEETPGIFNWMLEGLYRIFEKNGFTSSKTTEETKAEFRRVSDPFNAWIYDCCVFLPEAYLTRKEAYDSYKDYSDELGATPDSERSLYGKMRKTPKIRDTRIRIKEGLARVFQGVTLKVETAEDEKQTKLESVPDVPHVPDAGYPTNFENSKKVYNNIKLGTDGTLGTSSVDFGKYFPECQYPVCFDCGKAITELNSLTNIEGMPIHKKCVQKFEAQKKMREN